jgi:hypothetical protein
MSDEAVADYVAARESIRDTLAEVVPGQLDAQRIADAVLARLANLDPPLIFVRAGMVDELEALRDRGGRYRPTTHYVSTYCIHGAHSDCRLTCKLCGAPCRCSCHAADDDV